MFIINALTIEASRRRAAQCQESESGCSGHHVTAKGKRFNYGLYRGGIIENEKTGFVHPYCIVTSSWLPRSTEGSGSLNKALFSLLLLLTVIFISCNYLSTLFFYILYSAEKINGLI